MNVMDCAAAILGGGRGSRLFPLTQGRAKPAVPLAGKFRLIDIPISNCLNSNIQAIFILTQFNSASLHRHISQTYRFDNFRRGFVQVLAAQQSYSNLDWYQGTADAVRQNLSRLVGTTGQHMLILSGDQLYRMNFSDLHRRHVELKADVTIGVIPVLPDRAGEFGIVKTDSEDRIVNFYEKPDDPEVLKDVEVSPEEFQRHGIDPRGRCHLASMGIYMFDKNVLVESLENETGTDFGKEIIPNLIQNKKVCAYYFDGYWEDIGTIAAFFEANLALTRPVPPFDFYNQNLPIFTRPRFLPSSKIENCQIHRATIAEGSILEDTWLEEVVVGIRAIIRRGTQVRRSVLMGADYFLEPRESVGELSYSVPIGIGEDCIIENAIIDKNARIGPRTRITNEKNIENMDGENYYIRDGIVIIPSRATIPEGTVI